MTRTAERLAGLPSLLVELLERHNVPGASVGVLSHGDMAVFSAGLADMEAGTDCTPQTLFEMGSITKIYTATAALRLVDRGLLSLSTRAVDVLPEFALRGGSGADITTEHLLSHTAGIDPNFYGPASLSTIAELIQQLSEASQLHPAGATWAYSNCGYVVLASIIERLTGLSFAEALKVEVLDPLGDATTRVGDSLGLRAVGYEQDNVDPNRLTAQVPGQMPAFAPAGSTPVSTPAEILRLVRAHLNEGVTESGVELLSAAAVTDMRNPRVAVPANPQRKVAWGLGWTLYQLRDGRTVLGHGGSTYGFLSYLVVEPTAEFAVVIMLNAMHGAKALVHIGDCILGEFLGSDLAAGGAHAP